MQQLSDGHYPSVVDFIDAVNNECINKRNRDVHARFAHGDAEAGAAWLGAGCNTADKVQTLVKKGWPDGQKRALALLGDIDATTLTPRDLRRRIRRADMGDNLDIASVYAGRFQTAWTTARRKGGMAPQRVDILANMICSGGDESDVLFWRGAAAIALANCLETAGYMVRIVVGFGGNHYVGGRVSCRITVKDHDKPLDVSTMAAVTLPGFFRALGHAWIAGHCNGNCGSPGISVEQCNLDLDAPEVMLTHSVHSKDTAIAWLKTTINEINTRYGAAAPGEAA